MGDYFMEDMEGIKYNKTMTQVKLYHGNPNDVVANANNWLKKMGDTINILDVQYQTEKGNSIRHSLLFTYSTQIKDE